MKIISERKPMDSIYFTHEFYFRGDKGSGFSFPVSEDGKLLTDNVAAIQNYKSCLNKEYDVIDRGIVRRVDKWIEPAILECDCGEHVTLCSFTNTCDSCGSDYNLFGQLLAPREQWGEETGESWMDCY